MMNVQWFWKSESITHEYLSLSSSHLALKSDRDDTSSSVIKMCIVWALKLEDQCQLVFVLICVTDFQPT